MEQGLLIVLSGPSGAGKGSIREQLSQLNPNIRYGVSCTTRARRPGEVEGVNYHFLEHDQFMRWIDEDKLVEWAEVYGNYYGTPRQPMEEWLASGHDVIIEKDIQGALALKKVYPHACYVFILPPSLTELQARIKRRGTENAEVQARRLASAAHELTYLDQYDYAIVNDDLSEATARLQAIISAESSRVSRQPKLIERYRMEGKL